ncbi:MAG: GAF domain-containing protein, partial [Leptolyngbya sp. SIO3F4]|nr:GAF domain-containing protein [Leptolyngbya sp. SIO3F4]
VEHLHSLQDLENSIERSRLFGDIAFRARKSLDLDAVLRVVLEGGIKILQTNRLLVYRFNPDWSGTMISEAISSDRWPRVLDTKIFDPCFKGRYVDLYRNGRVRAINDIYQEPGLSDCHIRTLEQYDVKANLVAPIRIQGELYGLLIAHHCDSARVWNQSEMEFLSELATQTEYAVGHLEFIGELENARQTAEQVSLQQREQREAIQHQLTDLRQSLEMAFQGDLRVRALPPEGDIGVFAHFLNDSIEHLQQIVQEVQRASETVTQNAHSNQNSVSKLSAATLRQSNQLANAMEAIESITEAIQQVDGNAQSAQLKVQQADQVFQEGDRVMNRAVDVISMLQTRVEETAQQVKRLGEASQNISRVVNLIRDLAGQTNVLALNASIEANSSGDQGQGFSVVAEEVRSLAEQSTVATREIETLVEEIQTETNQVVSTMESWGEEVSASTELVETTRQRLTAISTLGGEIRILVEAIAQATLVQRKASTSVSHTMQDMSQISQENSRLSVNVAESFQQLLQVANRLQARIDQFKVQ